MKLCVGFIFCFLFSQGFMFGQTGFNKIYDNGRSIRFKSVIINDKSEIVTSSHYYDSFNLQQILITCLDTFGNIERTFLITDPKSSSHLTINDGMKILSDSSNNIVLTFGFYNRRTLGVAFIDIDKNIAETKEYEIDSIEYINAFDILSVPNGYLISGGCQLMNRTNTDGFLLNIDKSGNMLWLKVYGEDNSDEVVKSITYAKSGDFLIGGSRINYVSGNYILKNWIAFVDSTGKLVRESSVGTTDVTSGALIAIDFDTVSGYMYCIVHHKRKSYNPDMDFDISAPILVIKNEIEETILIDSILPYAFDNELISLAKCKNNFRIGCGTTSLINDQYISPVNSAFGSLLKFDDSGIIQWSIMDTATFDIEFGSLSYLNSLVESNSGSIYAVGRTQNYDINNNLRSYGWIIKATSDGCIDSLCIVSDIDEDVSKNNAIFSLYPNPASNELFVYTNENSISNYYFDLYSPLGSLVLHTKIFTELSRIDIQNIIQGIYIWKISHNNHTYKTGKVIID